jgi:hypothetical protein
MNRDLLSVLRTINIWRRLDGARPQFRAPSDRRVLGLFVSQPWKLFGNWAMIPWVRVSAIMSMWLSARS